MIADLKPYAAYKDSGLAWLGRVPAHWAVNRLKNWVLINDKVLPENTDPDFSFSYLDIGAVGTGALVRKPSRQQFGGAPSRARRILAKGDTVVSTVRTYLKAVYTVGITDSPLIASTGFAVITPQRGTEPGFLGLLAQSHRFTNQVMSESVGIAYPAISETAFGNVAVAIPPPEEQAAIVRLLDWANARLERTIRAKRRVIALLTEQKQAIIHRAVTRGLDPAVPLKPSGIAWLGDIPAHWELWRISRFAKVGNGSTPSRANPRYWNGGTYPWLNSSQVNRGFIDSADQFVTSTALHECHLPKVQAGSLLVAITGQGKTHGMSAELGVEATINQHIAYITPRVPVTKSEYLYLYFTAAYFHLRAASEDSGSTKGAITCEDLKRFKIAVPPQAEQLAIQSFVDSETQTLKAAISRLNREIDLLREYRTRLVADVVTGKLDVREAAAGLPEDELEATITPEAMEADDDTSSDEETGLEA